MSDGRVFTLLTVWLGRFHAFIVCTTVLFVLGFRLFIFFSCSFPRQSDDTRDNANHFSQAGHAGTRVWIYSRNSLNTDAITDYVYTHTRTHTQTFCCCERAAGINLISLMMWAAHFVHVCCHETDQLSNCFDIWTCQSKPLERNRQLVVPLAIRESKMNAWPGGASKVEGGHDVHFVLSGHLKVSAACDWNVAHYAEWETT